MLGHLLAKIDRKNLNVRHKAKRKEGIEDKYEKRRTGEEKRKRMIMKQFYRF